MVTEKQIWTGFRFTTKRNRNWERTVGFARAQHELHVQTTTDSTNKSTFVTFIWETSQQ